MQRRLGGLSTERDLVLPMRRLPAQRWHSIITLLIVSSLAWSWLGLTLTAQPPSPSGPASPLTADPLPDGAVAAERFITGLRVPAGLKVELFAAEPALGNPVAICLDERNRVYVAEEYRFNRGTEENRTRPFLLEDDLQVRTLDDRLAMYRKHLDKFPGGWDWFTRYTDQVRLLEDVDGNGRAERSTIYASGFNQPLDGMAAGLVARDGQVWLTCIPSLWRLRDSDGDGKAEEREKLLEGFGVNAAFLGHDLHGVIWGPDGRLYFSVGDRGFHVRTKEGTTLETARRGAVFRCRPDGRDLEVIHTGLRNPQEIAFDDFGNLFAADNNCDRGDHSRLVYVVDGGDSGWNMAFQTVPDPYPTGPWHAERMWYVDGDPAARGYQPAWVLPPVGKLGAGPSGFTHYPGLGLADRYRDHFFLCNYTGNGGLESFAVEPRGAGFTIVDAHDFLKPLFATDAEFGYDGQMYVSDFVGLEWNGGSKGGRIYRLFDPEKRDSADVRRVRDLFAAGFSHRENDELAELLRHPDQRVRLRAQYALAERGEKSLGVFRSVIGERDQRLARLHALWGLGQVVRDHRALLRGVEVGTLLADEDAEFRAQVTRLVADCGPTEHADRLIAMLEDPSPRVRFMAAESLGRLQVMSAAEPLWKLLRANADADSYIRHAAVVALARLGVPARAASRVHDPDSPVRLAAVLVLRRQMDSAIASFLNDSDVLVATEAARAIHDLSFPEAALKLLADSLSRVTASPEGWPEAFTRRAINANYRLAQAGNWEMIARVAADARQPLPVRRDALDALASTKASPRRDRVTGSWAGESLTDIAKVRKAVQPQIAALLATAPPTLQADVTKLIGQLQLDVNDTTFVGWVRDDKQAVATRVAALELLVARGNAAQAELLEQSLASSSSPLRAAARTLIAKADAVRGVKLYVEALDKEQSSASERQLALAGLASLGTEAADAILSQWAERLERGQTPAELQLDVVEAVSARELPEARERVRRFQASLQKGAAIDRFRTSLVGGDAERGREIFTGHRVAQCVRCHKIRGQGGDAGPDLSEVSKRHERIGLLESLIDPNAKIAPNFGTVSLVLQDGRIVAGMLVKETSQAVTLTLADGRSQEIPVTEIDERSAPRSAMPAVDRALSPRELRDVVEYLSTLR